ncbi:hypothetical protein CFC21_031565 [Triticum aestivum]|uniref:DUF6598 domain-containing protein n=3 Tax=Triticinae TaxID=1648030 RepID=A0A3B6DJ33_WHEAT|nr:uncharacterized protein LOC123054488 [Triticum aestivum]KAF7018264.1 hypothetical protein CFC21_031565 [Triticum aestivum]
MGGVEEEEMDGDRGKSHADDVEAADPTPTTVAKSDDRDIKPLLEAAAPVPINNTGYGNADEMDGGKPADQLAMEADEEKQHMIERTISDDESDFGYHVDVDEWRATTFDSAKLLLLAADPVLNSIGYGNVDEMDRGKSAEQLAMEAEEIAHDESDFALYAKSRDRRWAHDGYFGDMTTLSSTQFTHMLPGTNSYGTGFPPTLQILSIKLAEIKGGLEWPLPVYGVVAARDTVDHNRNLLFARDRSECQRVEKDHPYLRLTGPSRAIVFQGGVIFEIQLKLRGSMASQDRALITRMQRYHGRKGTISFENCLCTAELSLEVIGQTVQATFLGIRVKGGSWPSKYGGRVVCFAPSVSVEIIDGQVTCSPDDQPGEVVLVDSRRRAMPMASAGYLLISRQVVSVESQGSLKVVLQTYSASGDIDSETQVCFAPEYFNARVTTCKLSGVEVEMTVAWSRMVTEKDHITSRGWVLVDGDIK